MYSCQYCERESKTKNSLAQHEIRCKSNPNRIEVKPSYGMLGKKGSNQYIKGTAKPLTEEQRKKISERSKSVQWSEERRKLHSERMKEAVRNNPESYNSSNRGRTKQIIYDGIKFHGSWEVEFYKWAKENNLNPQRNEQAFEYEWNGKRSYFPDFYLPTYDAYVEVKGYETERDRQKWLTFPKKLYIIRRSEIEKIKRGTFSFRDHSSIG